MEEQIIAWRQVYPRTNFICNKVTERVYIPFTSFAKIQIGRHNGEYVWKEKNLFIRNGDGDGDGDGDR